MTRGSLIHSERKKDVPEGFSYRNRSMGLVHNVCVCVCVCVSDCLCL